MREFIYSLLVVLAVNGLLWLHNHPPPPNQKLSALATSRPFVTPLPMTRKGMEDFCEKNLPATRITIQTQDAAIEEVNNESIQYLTSVSHTRDAGMSTLGLTSFSLGMRVKTGLHEITFPGQSVICSRPELTITVYAPYHKVSIAQELRPGTCAYDAVRTHEYRHVAVNKYTLTWAAAILDNELKAHFGNKVFYGDPNQLQQQFNDAVNSYWIPRLQALQQEGLTFHKQIDTPEEYARNNVICNGDIPRIIQASR